MSKTFRRTATVGVVLIAGAIGVWFFTKRPPEVDPWTDPAALLRDVRSQGAEDRVRATCTTCHVFPPPDMLPREVWSTAIRGMYNIAARRNVALPLRMERVLAWYAVNAPEELPAAAGRTDAGPGSVSWETSDWRPEAPPGGTEERRPAVTHVEMAFLLGGRGLDVIVSDVTTNKVHLLRPYDAKRPPLVVGTVPNPGRASVTDLDGNGDPDLVVAALGQLAPTSDPVGSVMWFRRSGPESFEGSTVLDGLGRVADVRAADLTDDGRTDLLVAVFGWMESGGLLWLENEGGTGETPSFVTHVLDSRPGFTDVRAADLNGDGRLDIVALIAQEFQQVMVYWATDDGYRPEIVFQAPNPDWGFTGLDVADFTGNGLPDLIVANGDNLDLTVPKPFHGVALIENLGDGAFAYRHLTALYGAHKPVVVDLTGSGRPGIVVSAYLPPTVAPSVPAPIEALLWLDRVGPTQLVRRVLKAEGADHMTMAAGDATGDGRPDLALGFMDLGVVDPKQARPGSPLESYVTLWRNLGVTGSPTSPGDVAVIDWVQGRPSEGDGNR